MRGAKHDSNEMDHFQVSWPSLGDDTVVWSIVAAQILNLYYHLVLIDSLKEFSLAARISRRVAMEFEIVAKCPTTKARVCRMKLARM